MGTAREWECVILRLNGLSRTKYRYYVMRVENYFCSIHIGALCGNLLRVLYYPLGVIILRLSSVG